MTIEYSPESTKLVFPKEDYSVRAVRSNGEVQLVEPVFLDLETTGLNRQTCDVVEWGLLSLDDVLLHAYTAPRSGAEIDPKALEINGFDEEEARLSPRWWGDRALLLMECQKLWAGKVIVGSNPQFDMAFIERDLWDILRETPTWFYRPVDVSVMAYFPLASLQSMHALGKKFSTEVRPLHTAVTDAEATREVYVALMNDIIATERAATGFDVAEDEQETVRSGGNLSDPS